MENSSPTRIAEDVEITGNIKSGSDIDVQGRLSGDLVCESKVVIGSTANIQGNVSADTITVQGQVQGNITAQDKIDLRSTANVNGDIKAKRLTVEDGVTFVGKSEVNPGGSRPSAPPAQEPEDVGEAADAEAADEKRGVFSRK